MVFLLVISYVRTNLRHLPGNNCFASYCFSRGWNNQAPITCHRMCDKYCPSERIVLWETGCSRAMALGETDPCELWCGRHLCLLEGPLIASRSPWAPSHLPTHVQHTCKCCLSFLSAFTHAWHHSEGSSSCFNYIALYHRDCGHVGSYRVWLFFFSSCVRSHGDIMIV